MKSRALLIWFLAPFGAGVAFAQSAPPSDPGVVTFHPAASAATITLGDTIESLWPIIAPVNPPAPFTFTRGTHLRIEVPVADVPNATVRWYKGDTPLAEASAVLDLPSVSTADSGGYRAVVIGADGLVKRSTATASVLIDATGPALLNVSTRARLSADQPYILTGFVVQPGASATMVLVRAVGPALAQFGISDPLAAPHLRVRDASGHALASWPGGWPLTLFPANSPAASVGAFPLPAGGKDIESIYTLSPGAYTAEVSSADGGAGTVLLEVYQLPM